MSQNSLSGIWRMFDHPVWVIIVNRLVKKVFFIGDHTIGCADAGRTTKA